MNVKLTGRQEPYQFESSYVAGSRTRCPTLVDSELTDVQLIQRFQQGDSGVFDLLYRRYKHRIYGVIRTIILHREDALDLTQEVFLKAYQGLGSFKKTSQFYSWLYRITINRW